MAIQQKLAQTSLDIGFRGAPFVRVISIGATDTSLDKSIRASPAPFYGAVTVGPPPPPSGGVTQQSMFLAF
jgi:hypothetical protein